MRPRQPTRRTSLQRREIYMDRGRSDGVQPATTVMRTPDGKSGRGDDEGKCIGSSGNDEEAEYGSTVCTGDEVEGRQGTEDGGGIQDAARRRRRNE